MIETSLFDTSSFETTFILHQV